MEVTSERDYKNLQRVDMLDDYLRRSTSKPGALVATALRIRSTSMRDILVRGAVDGFTYSEDLKRIVLSNQSYDHMILDVVLLGELGRLVLLQNLLEDDIFYGEALLVKAYEFSGPSKMPKHLRLVLVQHFIVTGQIERARSSLAVWPDLAKHAHGYLQAELDSPLISGSSEPLDRWLEAFNRPFAENGLAPVGIASSDSEKPFDRLQILTKATHNYDAETVAIENGDLVSVVLTAYRPDGAHLETSVRSILEQTWRNLELIIVDDCSGSEFSELFKRMESLDPRVRVIVAPQNRGTYIARNIGYAASRGAFITGQDDDDWSHPERIAYQIKYMHENPEAIGCMVQGIRCGEDLQKVRVGFGPTTQNSSSLFVRRAVFTATGGFLAARKAADTEFLHRVAKVTGRPVGVIRKPLSILRMTDGSLSRKDFAPGWKHSVRRSFRSSYEYWHANASKKDMKLTKSVTPQVHIPPRFDVLPDSSNIELDVVFAGDWQNYGGPQKSMLEEIQALTRAGYKVGVMNLEAVRFMTQNIQKSLVPAIQSLINEGYVHEVHYDDTLKIRLLILRYPPILQFFTHEISGLDVESMLILANQAPSELDGSDIRYLVDDCERVAERAFKVRPLWAPQGPQVRDFLERYLPSSKLTKFDVPGVLDLDEWWHERLWYRSEIPVVGRHSRDNRMKWPSTSEVMDIVYPGDGRFDVRIMGGARNALDVLNRSEIPPGWIVYKTDELPVKDFLWSLDYFVFYQHPTAVEAFGRAILEALASGVVVILPDSFKRVFGQAAIYCENAEIQSVIDQLHSDFSLYQRQVQQAKEVLNERFSYSSYVARIESLMALTRR